VTEEGAFGLYAPKGWKTGTQRYPNGRMVFVADEQDTSYISMLFLEKVDPKYNAVTFVADILKNLTGQLPDLKVIEARSSADRMGSVVKYQKKGPGNTPIEGRYSFTIKQPTGVVFGYEVIRGHNPGSGLQSFNILVNYPHGS
jgi:hypothetical protein